MGEQLLSDFLEEVIDEMDGRSTAKWGIALLAFVVGAAIAMAIVRRRNRSVSTAANLEPDQAAM